MRFPRFWRRPDPADGDGWSTGPRRWRDSSVADEVEAFLMGRLVDHLAARGRPVPAWAVLNRLAHADSGELRSLVDGTGGGWGGGSPLVQVPWASAERFIAGNLLARATTPAALATIQGTTLMPLELRLIERSKVEKLTIDQVFEAGAEALETFRSDR
jgi:hypothetical protein